MLSVSKAIKAGQGEYYLSLSATDDYYLDGEEPPGFWLGKGAGELGLIGKVEPDEFRNLLHGLSADGERKLVRNADSERRAGWDLTWSVPKSVSVAWSQADPDVRKRIEACVYQAVSAGVHYLEEVAGITRRGADGYMHESAKLILACFQHSTSRAQDPQLHVHAILQNIAVRQDGTTGTIEPRGIYRHQMAAGALFRAELAALLERNLGFWPVREGRAFELLGVDRKLMETFSQRRAQVLEALERRGLSGGKAAEIAALETRTKKESVTRESLFSRWHETGREQGWTAKELSILLGAPTPSRIPQTEMAEAASAAIATLTQTKSHFAVRDLTQFIAEEAQGRNLGAREVVEIRTGLLGSQELVSLGVHRGEEHWTTKEVLRIEGQLLESCETLHSRERPTALAESGATPMKFAELSSEQRLALRHVCETLGGIRVVSGIAGTGKSTLFRAAREVWEAEGMKVFGAALSGKAARGLEDATGIASQTLHRTLLDIKRGARVLGENTVIVIDEAAMVGTRQLAVVAKACVDSGATFILAGDTRQLQAIELGGAFAEISRRYGAAELTEIRRQRDAWARDAVRDYATGEAAEALSAYAKRGFVTEAEDGRWGAMERLISDWSNDSGNRDAVILGSTNADVSALNRLAQEARKNSGQLGNSKGAVGKEELFSGDRVLFTKNSMALSVMNGDRGTVRDGGGNGLTLTVELDSGEMVNVGSEYFSHIRLGYALTTHKSQGMTVEKTYILVSGQNDLEMSYVQASRARGETRWYLGNTLGETTHSMGKSHRKEMATSFPVWAEAGPELELLPQR